MAALPSWSGWRPKRCSCRLPESSLPAFVARKANTLRGPLLNPYKGEIKQFHPR